MNELPAMPLDELRERHRALGALEELPGERTILTRCGTFEGLLRNGSACAESLRADMARRRESGREEAGAMRHHPELCALVLEAWPS
jgi:hypothetical protein